MANKVKSQAAARRDHRERLVSLREKVLLSHARAGGSTDPRRRILRSMHSALGAPLTAALTGVGGAAVVSGLLSGRIAFDRGIDQQLCNAHEVTLILLDAESPEVVQAWLLGMNPLLDDRAPAAVLPEDPAAVLRAARFFVANG